MGTKKTDAEPTTEEKAEAAEESALAFNAAVVTAATGIGTMAQHTPADDDLPDVLAIIQDMRRSLGELEAILVARFGKTYGNVSGELADGRRFEMYRTKDRKEWDHDGWKRDARREVAEKLAERYVDPETASDDGTYPDVVLIDTETGEAVELKRVLQETMLAIQEVHGAAPPKTTALKKYGLYGADYSTSTPGVWRFSTVAATTPTAPAPTTTEKDSTDA